MLSSYQAALSAAAANPTSATNTTNKAGDVMKQLVASSHSHAPASTPVVSAVNHLSESPKTGTTVVEAVRKMSVDQQIIKPTMNDAVKTSTSSASPDLAAPVASKTATTVTMANGLATTPTTPTQTVLSPGTTPCKVCGDEASGFHYGVDSCEGCKVILLI